MQIVSLWYFKKRSLARVYNIFTYLYMHLLVVFLRMNHHSKVMDHLKLPVLF